MSEQFTINLTVGDEQNVDLVTLLNSAEQIREKIGVEAVEFKYLGDTFTVSKNGTIRTVASNKYYFMPKGGLVTDLLVADGVSHGTHTCHCDVCD